ncbi:TonB-dependent receptor [Novosphingobium profundi]|uniref:TonB-dependent receptor plug domain-containing protein n=1 Tax=Novosphingobium profundi TaxID=1774954 RepID=UPI001BDB2772|nr:TonB-dependent receptor [Novosphingobium profundi]MBT0667357.1 TonB-dependent receptor [Novosphingobium profundi]
MTILLAGISACAITPAFAQDATLSGEQSADTADSGLDAKQIEEIVVTGSRLLTNGNSLPTPVTIVTSDTLLKTTPTNVPDGLKKLPAFAVSRGTSIQGDTTDNFTGNYLNLRGIGIQRNLILLDGHRVAPTSYTGAVDTNILPQMLLERVDIVTGGASAVYGSDAVSGVVNFVLNRKFDGLRVEGQSGISTFGDAASWRAGAAYGTSLLDDRLHIMASYEHFEQDGISKEDRRNGRAVYALAGSGTASDPFHLITNARNGAFGFQGRVLSGPAAGQQFVAPGVLGPFVEGTAQGGSLQSGGDGFYGRNTSATADLQTDQAFARVDVDVTDTIRAYAQGIYARAETFNFFYPTLVLPLIVGTDNPYISPAAQAAISDPTFVMGRFFDDERHRGGVRSRSETVIGAAGLEGTLGGAKWTLFYQHGQSTTRNTFVNNLSNERLYAAIDAVDEGLATTGTANGNIVCRASLTNSAYANCIPLNAFGASAESQSDALDYVVGNTTYNQPRFKLDNIAASFSGSLFDNWAGPVNFAVSGEYRWSSLEVTTDVPASVVADCGGIQYNCVQGVTTVYGAQVTPISASERVGEIAGELQFPLLRDSAIGTASLNGAFRYTHYSNSGGVNTWKIGGDWEPFDGLRLRLTRSRDIRAPSLYDRYQPATVAASGYQDVHTGYTGFVDTETSGNPNLTPEIANTLTFGAVFRPSALPGFSASIDYYKIRMDDVISRIDGRFPTVQNLCEADNGTGSFCDLYVRPNGFGDRSLANRPTLVRATQLNASSLKTWGIDGEVNYSFAAGSQGRVTLRGLAGYQPQLTTILLPGTAPQIGGGTAAIQGNGGVPKLRLTGFLTYSSPHFAIDLVERWRSSLKWDSDRSLVYAEPDIPSVAYTDVTFTAYIGEDQSKQIFLSVQNLFNKNPPVYVTSAFSGTPNFQFPNVTGDDVIGRYMMIGARMKF